MLSKLFFGADKREPLCQIAKKLVSRRESHTGPGKEAVRKDRTKGFLFV
jgi:hypothetical protein